MLDPKKKLQNQDGTINRSFASKMLIMLWKNHIIRKRRKLELILLLFQIFVWFGWGALRYAFITSNWFYTVVPSESTEKINFYSYPTYSINHPIGIMLSYETDNSVERPALIKSEQVLTAREYFGEHPKIDLDKLTDVLSIFHTHWERSIGQQPFRFFRDEGSFQESLRLDERLGFGIIFKSLDFETNEFDFELSFLNDEIVTDENVTGHLRVCREVAKSFSKKVINKLNTRFYRNCEASKYLNSPFVLAQITLINSILTLAEKRHGESSLKLSFTKNIKQTLIDRLEIGGVSLVAEPFILHHSLHSYYRDLAASTPIFIMFAFSRFILTTIHDLVAEKEARLDEIMKIFGLTTDELWFSWLTLSCIMNILYTVVTVLISRMCNMFGESSYLIITVIIYFYLLSLLTAGYMIGVFFNTLNTASAVGMFVNIILNAVGLIVSKVDNQNLKKKIFLSLCSPICFDFLVYDIIKYLPIRPMTISEFFKVSENKIWLFTLILVFDSFIYWFIAWYIDCIKSSSFGAKRPLHWPLMYIKAWYLNKPFDEIFINPSKIPKIDFSADISVENPDIEPYAQKTNLADRAVSIRGLVKKFKTANGENIAVNNLNLDIYKAEIFALLGHNGAGKTTTISMLSGLLTADEGDVLINGYSIRKNPRLVQNSISICPQHNVFIDELLVIEHLCFFAGLRGVNVRTALLKLQNPSFYAYEISRDYQRNMFQSRSNQNDPNNIDNIPATNDTNTWDGIMNMAFRFGLNEKLFSFPRSLSGGQKRRLWLALALIAEPKVIILDEPTSGVDPVGRQEIWKVIQNEKNNGRCIILTTHHMEEADILADRKAVMILGKVRCLGSSLFLKSRFGIGYYFEMQLEKNLTSEQFAIAYDLIDRSVKDIIPSVKKMQSNNDKSYNSRPEMLTYSLPYSETHKFAEFLNFIEEKKQNLKIVEFAISISTLEEVFFKLANEEVIETLDQNETKLNELGVHGLHKSNTAAILNSSDEIHADESVDLENNSKVAGNLVAQKFSDINNIDNKKQFYGILYLRFAQVFHNKFQFFIDIILPTLCFLFSIYLGRGTPGGLDYVTDTSRVAFNLDQSDKFLDGRIPYSVDPSLNMIGRNKLADLLSFYELSDHNPLLPINFCYTIEALRNYDGKECLNMMNEKYNDYLHADSEKIALNESANSEAEYYKRKPNAVKSFKTVEDYVSDDYLVYLFKKPKEFADGKNSCRDLRNFIWHTTEGDRFGVWYNQYAGGVCFEPEINTLNQNLPLLSDFSNTKNFMIRYMWNPYKLHSFPSFLNTLGNALLKSLPNSSQGFFKITNKPNYRDVPIFITNVTWGVYVCLNLGMSYLPHKFGVQILSDKYTKAKHSLIVMGLKYDYYWYGTFLIHWAIMIFTNFILTISTCLFIPVLIKHYNCIYALMILMLIYSAGLLLYAYFWSFVLDNYRSYSLYLQLSTMTLALAPAYLISMFYDYEMSIGGIPMRKLAFIGHVLFSFTLAPYLPIGGIISTMMVIAQAHNERRLATVFEFFDFKNGIIYSIIGGIFQILFYSKLILFLDLKEYSEKKPSTEAVNQLNQWKNLRDNIRSNLQTNPMLTENMLPQHFQITKDLDVLEEEAKIDDILTVYKAQLKAEKDGNPIPLIFPNLNNSHPKRLPLIMIDRLYHLYPAVTSGVEPTVAVKGLSLGVDSGEVLGLLGPNGAGKSTTINLLSCDSQMYAPCEGDVYLGGISATNEPRKTFRHLGLVPQFDALWPEISVDTHLYAYSLIKGLSDQQRIEATERLIKKLDLQSHRTKSVSELSGGNKRRTSIAVAFIGDPEIVLMDEPSSGIDPGGRRKLLEMLKSEKKKRAIILTTHSMEEAENLCTKVGIVVNGQLQCLNTCLAIKNIYGAGIRVEFELNKKLLVDGILSRNTVKSMLSWVIENLNQNSVLTDEVASRLSFTVPMKSNKLAKIFENITRDKEKLNITEFSVSQTTLDQVFTLFAKNQQNINETN